MKEPSPAKQNHRTYPLALLFLILTSAAILAAVAGPLLRAIDWEDATADVPYVLIVALVSIACGGLLGMIVGLYQFHRLPGALAGLAIGSALGPLAALLLNLGSHGLVTLLPAVLIGSGILLIVAWFTRPPLRTEDDEIVEAKLATRSPEAEPVPAKNPFAD
jgi:hypothetical protein